ncbi:hypothetical protein MKW92_052069 [Papaver armeniacum]|nr:hypothetical protein MKW92_052069 [Papaver armeniacum]
MSASAAASFFQSKPGCQTSCGDVIIPYPFGIAGGEGCSVDGVGIGYSIKCNTSFYPPKPFIPDANLEVISISETEIRVKNSWVAAACFTKKGVEIDLDPFSKKPTNELSLFIGRTSFTFSNTKNSLNNNHTKVWSFDPCSYAFIAEKDQYSFRASDLLPTTNFIGDKRSIPLVLDWVIGNKTCEEAKDTLLCQNNSVCVETTDVPGYRCTCLEGYEGNPYLTPGCQGKQLNTPGQQADGKQVTNPAQQADATRCGRNCFAKKQEFPILKATLGKYTTISLLTFSFIYLLKQNNYST